eukprot:17055-Eustigmatos_ZCMA.PRE.1
MVDCLKVGHIVTSLNVACLTLGTCATVPVSSCGIPGPSHRHPTRSWSTWGRTCPGISWRSTGWTSV